MLSWLPLAIFGHLSNAFAFIIDKALLRTTFKHSGTYVALIGGLSLLVVVAVPWIKHWPPVALYPAMIGFGLFFVFALLFFFKALKHGEASRVIPIVGSLIPVFTLVGEHFLLDLTLTTFQWIGFVFLLVATWMLTTVGGEKVSLPRRTLILAILSALGFAIASLCGKYAFLKADFLPVFVISRLTAGVVSMLLGFAILSSRRELLQAIRPSSKEVIDYRARIFVVIGQVFGAVGFILIQLALAQGSASLVNALQAVQYAAIILVAWVGGKKLRHVLHERLTAPILLLKGLAIVLVALGLGLMA